MTLRSVMIFLGFFLLLPLLPACSGDNGPCVVRDHDGEVVYPCNPPSSARCTTLCMRDEQCGGASEDDLSRCVSSCEHSADDPHIDWCVYEQCALNSDGTATEKNEAECYGMAWQPTAAEVALNDCESACVRAERCGEVTLTLTEDDKCRADCRTAASAHSPDYWHAFATCIATKPCGVPDAAAACHDEAARAAQ